jgi:hypothetical protein
MTVAPPEAPGHRFGALVPTAFVLGLVLSVTAGVFDAPQDLVKPAVPMTVLSLLVLALAPTIRFHGVAAIVVGLALGYMGFWSFIWAMLSGWLRYETTRWVGITIGVLWVGFMLVALALVGVGIAGIVKRDLTASRLRFGWWYVGLAAVAIVLQQMAWIVKFTIWGGPG